MKSFIPTSSFLAIFIFLENMASILSTPQQQSAHPSVKAVPDLNLTFHGEYDKAVVHSHKKVVVCYVGTWSAYRTPEAEGAYDISHIDPTLCTHLIYSFAGLDNTTYTIKPLDPWLDQHLTENGGGRDWYTKFNDFKQKYPHLKVLLAIGGWNEGSVKYSIMASNPGHRQAFIQSAVDLIKKYGFDGLDMDWEFPGDRGGSGDDKRQFTVLIKELRSNFDKHDLLLTSAFGPAKSTAEKGYELRELSKYLDHVHLMCYDYHGTWDNRTGHNAPLYSSPGDGGSIEESVNYYLSQGVPPNKLVVGFPFYGRTFLLEEGEGSNNELSDNPKVRAGLNQGAGAKGFPGPYTKEDGFLGYNEICRELISNHETWKVYWDDIAKVPYMRNGNKWVSFDNPDSIKQKVKYLMLKGLAGAMVWSIDTDDFNGLCGVKNPLLRSINYQLYRNMVPDDATSTSTDAGTHAVAAGSDTKGPSALSLLTLIITGFITFY